MKEIKSEHIQKVILDMKAALAAQDDGIGLAAPQIGVSLRIFIVSKKVLMPKESAAELKEAKRLASESSDSSSKNAAEAALALAAAKNKAKDTKVEDMIFINPVITKESKEKKWMEGEGCLSVRWIYGKVYRSTKVTVRARDENGKIIERGASGLLAHIFQHEVDHLNGILFIDKARDLEEIDPKDAK